MKFAVMLFILLFTAWACTPMTDEPAADDQKEHDRKHESYSTDRPS